LPVDFRSITRSRAPSRLGLAGGGTDLSPYCDEFGGTVLNTTIDRFAYAFINPRDDDRIVLRAKDLGREEVLTASPTAPEREPRSASWRLRAYGARLSTDQIERLCEIAFANGAHARKISGAGGGGFLMFIVPPEDRLGLITALNGVGAEAGPLKFTNRDAKRGRSGGSRGLRVARGSNHWLRATVGKARSITRDRPGRRHPVAAACLQRRRRLLDGQQEFFA
jgi:galactokinase/mevalonate kinase-like predicted kinase